MKIKVIASQIRCPKCNAYQCIDLHTTDDSKNEKEYQSLTPEAYQCHECKIDYLITASVIVSVESIEPEPKPETVCCTNCHTIRTGFEFCKKCGSAHFEIVAK